MGLFKYDCFIPSLMSVPIHYLTIKVFATEDENAQELQERIEYFLPEEYEDKKVKLEREEAVIEQGSDLYIYTASLKKSKHIRDALKLLKELLGKKQCEKIISQENRVDEKGALYIRIDKKRFAKERTAELVDHGDCFHFKFMLAAHPKTRKRSLEIAQDLFRNEP